MINPSSASYHTLYHHSARGDLCLRALQHRNGDAGGRKTNTSALRKCRMVEGQPGETAYLTANMLGFITSSR